jgi:hypothetical protein
MSEGKALAAARKLTLGPLAPCDSPEENVRARLVVQTSFITTYCTEHLKGDASELLRMLARVWS